MIIDFLRKNLFTLGGVIIFILVIFSFMNPFDKLFSNQESINKLKKENQQLKKENYNLLESSKKLKIEQTFYTEKLNGEINGLKIAKQSQAEDITRYQKVFEYLQKSIKNELADSLGIFSPKYVKKGSKIAGLTVSNIREASVNGYSSVDFTGEILAKGSIIYNQTGSGGKYAFLVEENIEKIPHTLQAFDTVYFNIKNDNELIKALGDKLEKMSEFGKLQIEGVFKNYSCNLGPEESNTAEFVRLVSQY